MRALEIRKDICAQLLRREAKKEKDGGVCRRLLGIAHLIETGNRQEAQKISCLSVSNFLIWMQRFNEQGIQGLRAKRSTGRPIKIIDLVQDKLKERVLKGPDCEEGLARYRLVDLQDYLAQNHDIIITVSGLWRNLQRLGLTWKTARQRHPQSDINLQESFKKTLLKS